MKISTILFDLDGTLLPMDQNEFQEAYFAELTRVCASGYDKEKLIRGIWAGTLAMIGNDGGATNRERFMDAFAAFLGEEARALEPVFDGFYANEFDSVKRVVKPRRAIVEAVDLLKEKGYTLSLATNPVFPRVATLARMRWAGLRAEDFALVTTYEDSRHCKPNLDYFRFDVLEKLGKSPDECLMVGNDVEADMCARDLGMEVYLITDFVENPRNEDISEYRHGTYEDFLGFVRGCL